MQVLIVTPSPLFFLKVGRKKGGITVGQYGTVVSPCLMECLTSVG